MALEVVTGTSQTTTTAMMQRRHYAIIRTASARTIRSTGLLLHRHRHRRRQLEDTMEKAQLSSICGSIIRSLPHPISSLSAETLSTRGTSARHLLKLNQKTSCVDVEQDMEHYIYRDEGRFTMNAT